MVPTAQTAEISMQVFRTLFPDRLTSHTMDITWPAQSTDHAVPDYFPWGYVKSKVHETCPANTGDLKQQLLECIQGNSKEMLRVIPAFPSRLQVVIYKVSY
jgi:hypothetical protein